MIKKMLMIVFHRIGIKCSVLLLFFLMSGLFCSNGLNEKTGVCLKIRIFKKEKKKKE